jgi:hypothetical protein
MNSRTQQGYLLLADISGYTSFLTKAELDHAREIIADLLEVITARLRSLVTIAKLEGDAVFAYAPAAQISRGELLLDAIDATYAAFRNRIQSSQRRTTCGCNGCRVMPGLDLKFMVHFGAFALHRIAGHEELVGQNVILIHRLLKNHVADTTGFKAYALFTREALEQTGIAVNNLSRGEESYDHLGTVTTYSTDLRRRYDERAQSRRAYLTEHEAHVTHSLELRCSPAIVWDWLNDPLKRQLWSGIEVQPTLRPGGRTQEGAQNHCVHGASVSVESILDWQPFDYFTVVTEMSLGSIQSTSVLTETANGTTLHDRAVFFPRFAILKPFARLILRILYSFFRVGRQYRALKTVMESAVDQSRQDELVSVLA